MSKRKLRCPECGRTVLAVIPKGVVVTDEIARCQPGHHINKQAELSRAQARDLAKQKADAKRK